jgi:hypothetical protein
MSKSANARGTKVEAGGGNAWIDSHAHSLVFKQVGKGAKFDRSKQITDLVTTAIKQSR